MVLVGRSESFSFADLTSSQLGHTECAINADFNLDEDPLVHEEHIAEVEDFLLSFPDLTKNYIPIAVIGEGKYFSSFRFITVLGTFSTVFKAIDVHFWSRDSSGWTKFSRQDPDDPSKIFTYFARMGHIVKTRSTKRALSSPVNQAIKQFLLSQYFGIESSDGVLDPELTVDLEELKAKFQKFPPQCVAIKRINSTSGPKRISEEMKFLTTAGGEYHVVPLINALRFEDQVLLVFPYFRGEDFRDFMLTASATDIADYMRLLLEALAHLHRKNLIHRDVKPSNFLFARRNGDIPATAVLVDFGLAQVLNPNSLNFSSATSTRTFTAKKMESIARLRATLEKYPPGYVVNDPRQQLRASRAGTRGFRAPEVLFKLPQQSTLIDVWSTGVILLMLLTRRYPFFQSNDDIDALVEIACIFGNKAMREAAKSYHRTWKTNVGSVPEEPISFDRLVKRVAPDVFGKVPVEVFDLLENMLKLVVTERYTAEQALTHPFLAQKH